MIGPLVELLRPAAQFLLVLPKRRLELPEQGSAVRVLRPSEAWRNYRLAVATLGWLGSGLSLVGAAIAATFAMHGAARTLVAGLLSLLAVGSLLAQWVIAWVDWETREYAIGERSIRVREGVLTVREVTLSFANIQNVDVDQGPLEQLFGIRTVRLSTAGGGNPLEGAGEAGGHGAQLVGLDDAQGLKLELLGRMTQGKGAGLGEEPHVPALPTSRTGALPAPAARLARLREVRDAALALRAVAEGRPLPPPTTTRATGPQDQGDPLEGLFDV